eukprot:g6625.t1
MSPRRSGEANPHHYSVCMISAQYLARGEGTGVLVNHVGYYCIVAGTHLLPSPVAASKALVHFILPGMPHRVTVSLLPEALFEVLGKHKSIVVTACDRPISSLSIAIPPALPAPVEYADTILRFSRSGRLQSPTDLTNTDDTCMTAVPAKITEVRRTCKHRKPYSKRHRRHKLEKASIARVRRSAVVPGTRAHRHPNDPDPVKPFAISVEDGGVVVMELVAHQGKTKRAYRAAVVGPRRKQGEGRKEVGGETGMYHFDVEGWLGAAGEGKGEKGVMEGGRGENWGSTRAAFSARRPKGLPGSGRGGSDGGGREKKRSKNDGEGRLSQREGIKGDETVAENKPVGEGKGGIPTVTSTPMLLEKMLHLFGHGTPASLELEMKRVGAEALRALRTPDGRSLVHLAAMSETLVPLEFVHRRLLMDVAFEEVPETGNTGLHLAAYCGRVECLGYLLSQGGDAAKKNRHGQTPAMLAVLTGRTEVLRWLLDSTKNTVEDLSRRIFPEELIDMVEHMDEAAMYGSPMYHILEEIFSTERLASEESDPSDDGQEDANPATDETTRAAGAQPPMTPEATDGGKGKVPDFEGAWELFGKGKIDARAVLAVLTRIHGESMDAWWPLIRAALPPGEPRLIQAVEMARHSVERVSVDAEASARAEARVETGRESDGFPAEGTSCTRPAPGAESVFLQSSTVKYLRDKISAEQFHETLRKMTGGGKVGEAIVAKVARGMPEDKAWALMEAHRKWKSEERLSKESFRKSRRARVVSGDCHELSVEQGSEDGRLWQDNNDKPRQSNPSRTRASASSGKFDEEVFPCTDENVGVLGTVHFGTASGATTQTVAGAAAVGAATTRGTRNDNVSAQQEEQAHSKEESQQQQPLKGASAAATRGGTKLAKGQPRTGDFGRSGLRDGRDDALGVFAPKANSPFTTRASAWTGGKGTPQDKEQPPEGGHGEGVGGNNVSANDRVSKPGNKGSGDDGDDGDTDKKTEAMADKRKMRDSMASDAQKLTSEFAAGRLATPHFFGAMLEEFGEQRLLTALPEILKILPKDKAAELETFNAKAEGKAGATGQARRKEKQEAEEKARKEQEQQVKHGNDTDHQHQAGKSPKQKKNAASKESEDGVQEREKKAAKAKQEDAQNMGKKNTKKVNDNSDTKISGAVVPDQEKEGKKKANQGKGKQPKKTAGDVVAGDDDVEGGELFQITSVERKRYDKSFFQLSQDGGAISPTKAVSTLKKSGLPRDALRKIWEMADTERDQRLNREEWAVAMHLVVCVTAKKLPLPARLPKCLRQLSSDQQPPLQEPQQQRQTQQGQPAPGKSPEKGEESKKQEQEKGPKKTTKEQQPGLPVDLKRATKEFENGGMKAGEFLPVLKKAFGEKELAAMWPKLLSTLPPERKEELVKVAGFSGGEGDSSSMARSDPRQVGLKEATACFKKGDMAAMEYHENVLKKAFGKKLPEMLPNILKALPPDRAAALKAVTEAEADEVRRLAEDAPLQWAMSLADRRVYDNAFMKLDKDKDGFLSSLEARPMLKKAVGDRLTDTQITGLWKMADIDGDTRLNREEWAIAYHIVRCVIKRDMQLPTTLPEVLGTTAGGRLPPVK